MMPNLPADVGSIDSGKTLREAFDKCLLGLYKTKKQTSKTPLTEEELEAITSSDIPVDFMWKGQPEVFFFDHESILL